jgi:hypothetical protein
VRFRLTSTSGQVLEEGEGHATVEGAALVVNPQLGQPIRVRPRDVAAIEEPEPYVVAMRLHEGPTLTLRQLGVLRTQLLAEFAAQRADDLSDALILVGVGTPESFPGAIDGIDAELRLYEDALVAYPQSGEPVQWPYSFIDDIVIDASGYRIELRDGEHALVVQRLARRTSEFIALLQRRVGAARGRTATFLGALLPGLGPIALRSAAGLLRDGKAAPRAEVEGVASGSWDALVRASTLPTRLDAVAQVAGLGEAWIGYQQQAEATTDWGSDARALLGLTAETAAAAGQAPVQDVAENQPDDLADAAGDASMDVAPQTDALPPVLGFVLVSTGTRVIVEVLNHGGYATYVFRGAPEALRAINRGFALLHFRRSGVFHAGGLDSKLAVAIERSTPLRTLREAFVGRAIHNGSWGKQLDGLLH